MISLILPYWDRQAAADKALRQLAVTYADLDFQVVIVDDGNREPFRMPEDVSFRNVIARLPLKDVPKSPTAAWNAGVAVSSGETIVLSCIEVLHTKPVLQEMESELKRQGVMGYVLAAAWCPEQYAWHTHSTVSVPECPPGSGIAFCAALRRSLFDLSGGFDEDYREGAGYEDRDFIHRLHKAGAKFVHRDDLVVTHPKAGATIKWPPEGFSRNESLFRSKWC